MFIQLHFLISFYLKYTCDVSDMAYSMHINYIVKYKGSLRRLRVGLGMCPPDRTCKIALNISEFHFTTLGKETRL